jgi:phosphocarrier protein HPr
MLAQLAMKFQSRIRLCKGATSVDAKSILELMTLGATAGTVLELEVEGIDAAVALEHIAALFETSFAPVPAALPQPAVAM